MARCRVSSWVSLAFQVRRFGIIGHGSIPSTASFAAAILRANHYRTVWRLPGTRAAPLWRSTFPLEMEEASAAAGDALAHYPVNPEAYRQIANIFVAQDRFYDAAVALIEGGLITTDFSLNADLLDLYRSAFSNSCAITAGPEGSALNPACDLVHKQFCAASVEAVKAALEAEGRDAARRQKQSFLNDDGCPAGPLDEVLPD